MFILPNKSTPRHDINDPIQNAAEMANDIKLIK